MKKIIFNLSLLFIILNSQFLIVFSQPVHQEWKSIYNGPNNGNDNPNAMKIDEYLNIYVTGTIIVPNQSNNYLTIMYNNSGVQQWAATYNGPAGNGIDAAWGLDVDNNGNLYVTGGSTLSTLGTFEYATIKYNSSGVQQWVKRYGSPNHIASYAYALTIDKQGYIYVTGSSNRGDSYGRGDYCTIKYDSNGDTLWIRRYQGPGDFMFGSSTDIPYSIITDDSGYVYVTGSSGVPTGPDPSYIATIKYKQNGDSVWVKRYGLGQDAGNKVVVDHSGNVYVTGYSLIGISQCMVTIKYNSSGIQQWVNTYQQYSGSTSLAYSEALDKNGNICICGYSTGVSSNYDYATIKYNPSGVQQWVNIYNGTGNGTDEAYDIATDDSNNVYVTGESLNSQQLYDFVTIKYNSNGTQQWLIATPGDGHYIAVDSLRNVYVSGVNVNGTAADICVIKYSQITGIKKISSEIPKQITLYQNYPNPFNPSTKIKFDIPKLPLTKGVGGMDYFVTLKIYDILGREVATLVNEQLQPGIYLYDWNANNYSSGIYYYILYTEGEKIGIKLMALIK